MIQFHNPEAETAVEDELYKLSYDIGKNQGENITVALLANGFPDSENFVLNLGSFLTNASPTFFTKFSESGNPLASNATVIFSPSFSPIS